MRLLIGYDGSSHSDAAINDLRRAGLSGEVEALVVSVGDEPTVPPFASHEVIEKALVGERVMSIVDHANKHVANALKQANEFVRSASFRLKSIFPSWQVRSEVLDGIPAAELVRRANEWQADLILVGSQGRSPIGRLILGSVSLQVATEARCSVRIGRLFQDQFKRIRSTDLRILVGLDDSPGAERAIRKVLKRSWPKGTELRIVAVDDGLSKITAEVLSIAAHGEHVSESRMIKFAAAKGLTVSAGLRKGDAQTALLAEAREWKADCIIIGSRSGIHTPGFFASSVSTGLAANAPCSIEIVR